MIINIPIQIEERILEEKVQKDLDDKLTEALYRHVEKSLISNSGYIYYDRGISEQKRINDGMSALIRNRIDSYFENHLDTIIDLSAERLEERLCKRKKIKEVAE